MIRSEPERGAIDSFERRLEAELKEKELEADRKLVIDIASQIAVACAENTGIKAVGGYNENKIIQLQQINVNEFILPEQQVALGSGAQLALEQLGAVDNLQSIASVKETTRNIPKTVAQRNQTLAVKSMFSHLPTVQKIDSCVARPAGLLFIS